MDKVKQFLKSWGIPLLVAFVIKSSFFDIYRVPSGSMNPTIMIGDYILVNKFSYGFRIPFSDLSLSTLNLDWNSVYLFGQKEPKRGDPIVFKYPRDPSINFIKRVVAVPGDTVEIRDKIVYINGQAIWPKEVPPDKISDDINESFKKNNLQTFLVKNGNREHLIWHDSDSFYNVNYYKRVVPPKKIFCSGRQSRPFSRL